MDPYLRIASLESDYDKLAADYRQEHYELLVAKQRITDLERIIDEKNAAYASLHDDNMNVLRLLIELRHEKGRSECDGRLGRESA